MMYPTPGSSWTLYQLRFYNIAIQKVSWKDFFALDRLPMSSTGDSLFNDPDNSDNWGLASAIDVATWDHENAVDLLGLRLLDAAKFTKRPLRPSFHPELTFTMAYDANTYAKPDLALYANNQTVIFVQENKRSTVGDGFLPNAMAQLVAEAIAAFSNNRGDDPTFQKVSTCLISVFSITA